MRNVMGVFPQKKYLEDCQKTLELVGVNFKIDEITSPSRDENLVFTRALIVHILSKYSLSSIKIGAILNRDHATVLHIKKYSPKKKELLRKFLYRKTLIDAHFNSSDVEKMEKEIQSIEQLLERKKEALNKLKNS